jgi:hypothetical protein
MMELRSVGKTGSQRESNLGDLKALLKAILMVPHWEK